MCSLFLLSSFDLVQFSFFILSLSPFPFSSLWFLRSFFLFGSLFVLLKPPALILVDMVFVSGQVVYATTSGLGLLVIKVRMGRMKTSPRREMNRIEAKGRRKKWNHREAARLSVFLPCSFLCLSILSVPFLVGHRYRNTCVSLLSVSFAHPLRFSRSLPFLLWFVLAVCSPPCLHGGVCIDNNLNLCACPPPFSGSHCQLDPALCGSNACGGPSHGECTEKGCTCHSPWTGKECEQGRMMMRSESRHAERLWSSKRGEWAKLSSEWEASDCAMKYSN